MRPVGLTKIQCTKNWTRISEKERQSSTIAVTDALFPLSLGLSAYADNMKFSQHWKILYDKTRTAKTHVLKQNHAMNTLSHSDL